MEPTPEAEATFEFADVCLGEVGGVLFSAVLDSELPIKIRVGGKKDMAMIPKAPILPAITRKSENQNEESIGIGDDLSYSGKLTNVEAQRIMAVLQEIQKKVSLIGLLPDASDRKISSVLTGDGLAIVKVRTLSHYRN